MSGRPSGKYYPNCANWAAGSLLNAAQIARQLVVNPTAMLANADLADGLILAEAYMMGLAGSMGRESAHDLVYDAARQTHLSGEALVDVLRRTVPIEVATQFSQLADA